ncbi:putative Cytosine deaminase [Spironucleus salmonicida]|uniref:Cytosine (Deoxycytidylate) family protein n=1 Tax=Spironucleus salmonicida TaxID=348837 RepID=V6LCU8_9EUKA|nr:putative Cytosine deaminase [Spironucleus salmonicida]|eukprot:EST42078.1 Cytosine (deoxycytidylate) family protein [Spironucleus salmonicida]
MERAMEVARIALVEKHVPIGCAMMCDGIVLATAYNDSFSSILHAEIKCLYMIEQLQNEKYANLSNVICYTTVEPCIMCAAALAQAGIQKVIFAAKNDKFGGICSLKGIQDQKLNWQQDTTYEQQAITLLQQFFDHKNEKISQ